MEFPTTRLRFIRLLGFGCLVGIAAVQVSTPADASRRQTAGRARRRPAVRRPHAGRHPAGCLHKPTVAVSAGLGDHFGVGRDGNTSPAGIDCGDVCSANFAAGTVVTLFAIYFEGSIFQGWFGDWPGWETTCGTVAPCTVTLDQAKHVTARFDHRIRAPSTFRPHSRWPEKGTGTRTITSRPPGDRLRVAVCLRLPVQCEPDAHRNAHGAVRSLPGGRALHARPPALAPRVSSRSAQRYA